MHLKDAWRSQNMHAAGPVRPGSRRMLRRAVVIVGATAGAMASMASAAITPAPTQLAPLAASPSVRVDVAAAGGWTAWSDLKDGKYVLTLRAPDGTISTPAAVAPASAPFRVALGKRSSGAIVAAYDTCPGPKALAPLKIQPIAKGCRIVLLDVASGTVKKLPLAKHTSANALPALSGDTVAFVALPLGSAAKTTARIMSAKLGSSAAATRWSAKLGHGNGPLQIAVHGKAVAALWSQNDDQQRVDAQTKSGAKVRTLVSADPDASCCQSDSLQSIAFRNATTVSVLDVGGNDEGESFWSVQRYALPNGKSAGEGARASSSGDDADALVAASIAEDGTREIVLAADAKHPYGVYAFKP